MLNLQSVKEPTGAVSENFLLALKADLPTTTLFVLGATSGGIAEIGRRVFPIVHSIECSEISLTALKKTRIAGPALFLVDAYSLSGATISPALSVLSIIARNSCRGSAIIINGLFFLDSENPQVNLAEANAALSEVEYQFYILGDTGLAVSKHSDLKVSHLIQALTISRLYDNNNLEITELFAAEEVIIQAEGTEREVLQALPISHPGGSANSHYYKFWSALSRLGQGELILAERELASATHDGFNHWRLQWYFAKIFIATGEKEKAQKALEKLAVLAPDFTPALDLIAEFSTRGSSLHITPTIDHAFPMMWKQMQECYLRVLRNLEADGIDKHDLDFVHPSWKAASEAIRGILMGPSDKNFLHHPVVSGMMLRQGFGISQEYEETYLRNCLKSDIREKIFSFVESFFGSLEKDCKSFNCSANTLGHLYYAARTSELFDKDQFKFIIEFGGGYGNLALVYKHLNPEATIVIIDLPEMLALQYLFLSSNIDRCSISVHEKAGMPIKPNSINLVPVFYIDSIQQVAELFISTFALSETPVAMQDRVFRRKFFNAENVYITGQFPEASDEHDWVGQAQLHESVRRQYSYVVSLPFHVFQKGVKLYEIAGNKRFNEVGLVPKELVTIYVPSYNSEKYLAATLESILAQSYRHFEVIVVNDGSMDRTKDIAEAFAKIDNRVRVVSHAVNLGLSAARNTGWMNASPSSSYIMNHDSDDISHPNKLRALVEHLQSNADIDAVGCFAEYFNDNNQVVGNPPIKWWKNEIRASFGIVNSMVISASLVRREMYEKIAPFRSEFGGCDDYDFWARALLNGYTLANIPCVMHRIRVHRSSMGATQHQEMEQIAGKIRRNYKTQIQRLKFSKAEAFASIRINTPRQSHIKKALNRSKKLTVLHTVEFYAPHTGGAEVVVQQISERLAKRGHHVTVATSAHPERSLRELNGVEVCGFAVQGKLAERITGETARYERFLREHPADVMMNYAAQQWATDLALGVIADTAARRVNLLAPCGYSALVNVQTLRWPHFRDYFEKVLPRVLPAYDAVVYHSGIYKDFAFGEHHQLRNGIIIPNGTDEEEFTRPCEANFREKYKITTRFFGLCVANFYPAKGQERLIESVRQLNRPDFTMVFIGKEGDQLTSLQKQAAGLNIRFLVGISREDTVAAFRSADLFLFASHIEASPLVILEAKAAKLPFLSTDCGNVREWKGGVVCSPEDLASQAGRLLDDEPKRRQLAEEGWREWKDRLTWNAVVDQWEDLYLRLQARKSQAAAPMVATGNKWPAAASTDLDPQTAAALGVAMIAQTPPAEAVAADVRIVKSFGQEVLLGQIGEHTENSAQETWTALAVQPAHGAPASTIASSIVGVIFSKDRPLQLDGTLRSFFARCQDAARCQMKVLYRASSECQPLYDTLIREYPMVGFVAEQDFRSDLIKLLDASESVLFVVDDNLFIRNFTATEMVEALREHPQAIGFSMRLGRNTTFCYPLNKMQRLPSFETVGPQILRYDWTRADCDFNYPLEVSSSVYRTADLQQLLRELQFKNPNTLEGECAARASRFQASHPQLLCFEVSRAFCNPINLVQTVCQNRVGGDSDHSPERLAQQFQAGARLDVEAYLSFTPTSCHQEVPLYFRGAPPPSGPAVSVVIPCYNQSEYLEKAVLSVVNQTYHNWELVIVNDGSLDDTVKTVGSLLATYHSKRIRFVNQFNQGLAIARNNGIATASGKYILPLDADDAIDPTFLSKAVSVMECAAHVHIVHTGHQTFGQETRIFCPVDFSVFKLVNANQISYCSLYRREVFEVVGGYNPNMVWGYEDWDFWIGAAKRGFRFQKIDEPLFFYRVKLESMLTNALRRHNHLKARIILNHPELYNRSCWEEACKVWGRVEAEAKLTRPSAFDCPVPVTHSVVFSGSNLISESGSLTKKVPSIAFTAPKIGACDIEILFKKHRWFDCARTCQELLAVHPGNIDAMKVLAESFVNLQDISSALEVYRHASLTNLDDASIRSRIQELESKLGSEAFPTPKQEAASQRGLAALENDQAAEALKHYRNAQTVGPAYPSLDHVVRELEVRLASAAPKLELQNNQTLGGTDSDSISRPSDQEKRLGPLLSTTAVDSNPARGTLTRPVISVILPTFNRPGLLTDCLAGFAKQSLPADQFEVVIVDDGSEPPVRTVADSFDDRLRICYHYQPNSGLAAARNQAIELASAPWLALHDDDDVPGPNYLQGCVDFHRKNPSETDILLAQVVPSPSLPINPLLEWTFDARNGVIGFPEPGVWHGFTRFYGGTSSCKRALFLHELYDTEYRFGYEDMELAFRLNRKAPLRVEYHPEVFSYLIRSPDFPGTFRRLYREGRSLRRFFQQQGEASFSVIPSEFRNCSEWVNHLEPRIPELMGLIRRLEIPGGGGQVSITIDGQHLTGNEALKASYSLCARFARGRGWLDFASGLDETRGLDRIKLTLDAYASSGSMGNQATETPTNLEKPMAKRALAYFHSNLFPPRSGAHRRCLSLLVALRTLGYEVTLVSSDLFTDQPWSDESVTGLAQHCGIQTRIHRGTAADRHFVALRQKAGNFWDMHTPPDLIASFRTAARETRPDVVLVNYAYCSGLTAVPELSDCLRVLEMHDLVSLSSSMAGAAWGQLGQGPYGPDSVSADFLDEQFNTRLRLSVDPEEYRRYSRFDLVTAISNIEADSIRTNAPGSNAVWLPMAHDSVSIDNRYDGSPIFVIFTNPFNIQGQLYFVEKVLPRVLAVIPNFKLRVVGDACRVLKPVPGIELLGFVPDLKSVYADASYAICPLIGGTGMQVKIVEAMAHGIPVVALRNVAGSSPIEHGVNGFIADTAEQFANHVIQLHQDRQFCRRLGQAAREKIAAGFSCKDLAQRLENALKACATARAIRGAALPSSRAAVQPIQNLFLPVRWLAPIFNPSGYASEAINFVLQLQKNCALGIQHNSSIWSDAFTRGLPAADREALLQMSERFVALQGGICISHGPAGFFTRLPDADYSVGRTMFETDRISSHWVAACNRMDEVWVPSQFNVETFANSGVERSKLVVMPGAVDSEFFDPARHTVYPLPNPARFNFLSIFEWSSRKGWDVLLAAYLREFSADDDVCLWLRTYLFSKPDGDPTEAIWQRIQEFTASLGLVGKNLPRIELIAEQVPSDQLPGLYLACDCYVAPSRGEGWGRPQHEAMLMERPVIATNWSANTEFMTVDNSYLLHYEVVDTQGLEPELSHYKGHRWANPSESHLRTLMRHVFTHPEEARLKGQAARKHMARHYNREAVADRVIYRLQSIERSLKQYGLPPAPVTQIHASTSVEEDSLTTLAIDGSFFDLGSLSSVNRALLQALDAEPSIRAGGVCRAAAPIGTALPPEVQCVVRRVFRNAPLTTEITVRHEWPPRWDKPQRGAWVLIQPWEFGSIPAEWAVQLRNVDEIWCPSRYVRRLYLQAGIPTEKLKVLPNGYNPLVHHPNAAPTPIATHKRFKFLFVGGTIARKGADLLLATFLKTFRRSDDVCLVIKDFGGKSAYQGQTLSERIRAAQADTAAPEIVYLDQELSEQDLAGLYTACDCLVHPYRGEGFGLPVLEAMACALPVICTGGGATDDFATDEFVHRLPSRRAFIGNSVSGMKLDHRGWWLEPDLEELSGVMREVVLNPQPFKERAKLGAQHVLGNWTWAHSARTMAILASDLKKRLTKAG